MEKAQAGGGGGGGAFICLPSSLDKKKTIITFEWSTHTGVGGADSVETTDQTTKIHGLDFTPTFHLKKHHKAE